ncbi:MAG: folate-binding protein [Alphaproteobacteria bacterium]|nr:folate-binding protein [Alphaproteobacteria bacterium]
MTEATIVSLAERGVIAVAGPEARGFLQGMISNDVGKVSETRAIYAALLTPQGKYLHDFFIAEAGGALLIDCERARLPDLVKRLMFYRLRAKADIADRSEAFGVAAFFGEGAAAALGLGEDPGSGRVEAGGAIFVDPRLAALGPRAILPVARLGAAFTGFVPAAADSYDRHRLALGIPDGSRDLVVDRSTLLEANFEELNGVDFLKGCYVGQELTARTKYRGLVRKRLMRVDVEGPLPAPGTPLCLGEQDAGEVRSGLDGMAIALVRLDALEKAAAAGQPLRAGEARIRPVKPAWASF